MNHCPNCNYENPPMSTFCGHCGASLAPASSPLEPTQRPPDETPIPLPPPPPGFGAMATLISPNVRQLHKRTTGNTIHSLLWYLWGIFCFSFGLAGGILHGAPDTTVGVLFVGCCLAGLIILIPLLLYRISFFLIWWARLILESGVLIVGLVLLPIVSVAHAPVQVLGIIFVLYGIVAAFVAFW